VRKEQPEEWVVYHAKSRWKKRAVGVALAAALIVPAWLYLPALLFPPPVPPLPADHHAPYTPGSPWNTAIPADASPDEGSAAFVAAFAGRWLTSDPTQYTYPVYVVSESATSRSVSVSGKYSDVLEYGNALSNQHGGSVLAPIPYGASPSPGTDGHLVVWNPATGDEWGFWQASQGADGAWTATNGYHYSTAWSGVPPSTFVSRGAGLPYFAGLVRPWEIESGRIGHALAFGYNYPSSGFVFPATKSDGDGLAGVDLPEGARLQLDPTLNGTHFDAWGLSPAGKVMARALQEFGMIVVDNSGRPKIYVEDERTAHWEGTVVANTVSPIPFSSFRVLDLSRPVGSSAGEGTRANAASPNGTGHASAVLVRPQEERAVVTRSSMTSSGHA